MSGKAPVTPWHRLLPIAEPANDGQVPKWNEELQIWELADAGGNTLFNGNRAIKRIPTVGLIVGGATEREFLENLFFPDIDAAFALTNLGTNYFEKGFIPASHPGEDPYNLLYSIQGSITANDAINIQYRLFNTTAGTAYPNNSAPYAPVTGPIALSLPNLVYNNDDAYQLQIKFTSGGVEKTLLSGVKYRKFILPYYFGMSNTIIDLPTNVSVINGSGLAKVVNVLGNTVTLNFNAANKMMYIIYDASKPDLTKILDPNGFNVLPNWTKVAGNVTAMGDSADQTGAYKMYVTAETTVNNGNFTFFFT